MTDETVDDDLTALLSIGERNALSLDDLRSEIMAAVQERAGSPDAIAAAVEESFGLDASWRGMLCRLVAALVTRGDLTAAADGSVRAEGGAAPEFIFAMVRVPVDEWDSVKGMVHRGRAAWISR